MLAPLHGLQSAAFAAKQPREERVRELTTFRHAINNN